MIVLIAGTDRIPLRNENEIVRAPNVTTVTNQGRPASPS
jgi:hypothetical protein